MLLHRAFANTTTTTRAILSRVKLQGKTSKSTARKAAGVAGIEIELLQFWWLFDLLG
jgi:hypothetical protein